MGVIYVMLKMLRMVLLQYNGIFRHRVTSASQNIFQTACLSDTYERKRKYKS
uniref:Uncharacterized protein n=1 Tax=Anguilla anguilla TaxID=7936 RepID=A0A0E9QB15_ANGAN